MPEDLLRRPGVIALAALARASNARARAHGLPPLLFFTDPVRTPDALALARRLPRGCGVVYRAFGAADAAALGARLAQVCRVRGLRFFVGADWRLARALRARALHLPERLAASAARLKRAGYVVTVAAHSRRAARSIRGASAIVISPVFPSNSPSAGPPLGERAARAIARDTTTPIYALGGLTHERARRLRCARFAGFAAIEAIRT